MKSEFLIVAQKVLEKKKCPMRPNEIVNVAMREGFFSDNISGKTPWQTMKSKLSVHVRRHGENSVFIRISPGRFFLRNLLDPESKEYKALPLKISTSQESVLVFKNEWFDGIGRFQGIKKSWKMIKKSIFDPNITTYIKRLAAEENNEYKQVLTYIMVTKKGKVLSYKRGSFNRVEDYLKGSKCIGFGGHVNQDDNNLFSDDHGIFDCAIRELKEELRLPEKDIVRLDNRQGLSFVGVLNDDSSIVGQRHFAFLLKYEISNDPSWSNPQKGEKSITQLRWLDQSFKIPIQEFEYWSQLCLRFYYPGLVKAAPKFEIRRRSLLKPPKIICVIGSLGSGKSEAANYLCKKYGYKEINSGKLIAKLLGVPPVPKTSRKNFQKKAMAFVTAQGGCEKLAKEIVGKVNSLSYDRILIDGIRQRETLEKLMENSGVRKVGVIYVHTPPDLAYEFFRDRESPNINFFQFLNLRNADVELEANGMINLSDAVLYNWTGQVEYKRTIREMMSNLEIF